MDLQITFRIYFFVLNYYNYLFLQFRLDQKNRFGIEVQNNNKLPKVLADFLSYLETIKGKSYNTIEAYKIRFNCGNFYSSCISSIISLLFYK